MKPVLTPHIRTADGQYLAGLVDGEGCFYITTPRVKGNTGCGFIVKLRADDRPLLTACRDLVGVGRLTLSPRRNDWAPTFEWRVTKKAELLVIVELFRRFPLRSRKARDFEIWSEAVDYWNYCITGRHSDWSFLEQAKAQLAAVRTYVEERAR